MNNVLATHNMFTSFKYLCINNFSKLMIIILSYWCSLRYFFPGYFNPLIPHHSDLFDYYKDSTNFNILDFFKSSRMTGDFVVSLTGNIHYKVTIIFAIILTIVNVLILISICEKIFKIKNNLLSILIYCLLIFSHPGFYINYTFDIYSTISFTFFILILHVWYSDNRKLNIKYFILILLLVFLCTTTKETYIVPIFCFLFFQILIGKNTEEKRYALGLLCVSILTVVLSLLRSKLFGSAFVSFANNVNSPYYTSFSVKSIISIFIYYLKGAINIYFVLTVLLMVLVSFFKKKPVLIYIMVILMGMSAYLPYSILPNHVVPHYSWLGVPLLFSVFLPLNSFIGDFIGKRLKVAFILTLCILYSLVFYGYFQSYTSVKWAIQPEVFNYNILKSFSYMKDNIKPSEKVLISGLQNSIENPFKSENVIKDSFPFKTCFYLSTMGEDDFSSYIKKVNVNSVKIDIFDRIIVYDSQGILIKELDKEDIGRIGNSEEELTRVLYPDIEKNINEQMEKPEDWYTNMNLGNSYLAINNYDKAYFYLDKSIVLCNDENPYPSFFMGQLMEKRNDYEKALLFYKKANTIEPDNINFQNAVARIQELDK